MTSVEQFNRESPPLPSFDRLDIGDARKHSCDNPMVLRLWEIGSGADVLRTSPCGNWRKCEGCRKARAGKIFAKVMAFADAIDRTAVPCYAILLTLTLSPQKIYYDAYANCEGNKRNTRLGRLLVSATSALSQGRAGKVGRERICRGMNRLMVDIKRQCKKQGSELLGYFSVYEFHRDGALHKHVVLIVPEHVRLDHIRLKAIYGEGFIDFNYGKDRRGQTARLPLPESDRRGSIGACLNYTCKYLNKLMAELPLSIYDADLRGTRFYSFGISKRVRHWLPSTKRAHRYILRTITSFRRFSSWISSTFGMHSVTSSLLRCLASGATMLVNGVSVPVRRGLGHLTLCLPSCASSPPSATPSGDWLSHLSRVRAEHYRHDLAHWLAGRADKERLARRIKELDKLSISVQ